MHRSVCKHAGRGAVVFVEGVGSDSFCSYCLVLLLRPRHASGNLTPEVTASLDACCPAVYSPTKQRRGDTDSFAFLYFLKAQAVYASRESDRINGGKKEFVAEKYAT